MTATELLQQHIITLNKNYIKQKDYNMIAKVCVEKDMRGWFVELIKTNAVSIYETKYDNYQIGIYTFKIQDKYIQFPVMYYEEDIFFEMLKGIKVAYYITPLN